MSCTCHVGPGKFEGEPALAFLAYHAAAFSDETTYRAGTSTDWFRSPFNLDTVLEDTVQLAQAYGYCSDCVQSALEDDSYGLSLYEDLNGFVYLTRYKTEIEFDRALGRAQSEDDSGEGD